MQAESKQTNIWCKICGITNSADAQAVEAAGADALGLVFYPKSRRYIELDQATEIAEGISCTKVGLFVDPTPEEVTAAIRAGMLDLLQFNGGESAAFCAQFGLPYIKALHAGKPGDTQDVLERELSGYESAWAIFLDTFVSGEFGGTGKMFDKSLWPRRSHSNLVVAGGLAPTNVATALKEIRSVNPTHPFGVDVSGGVEIQREGKQFYGNKDKTLVEQFIREARNANR